MVEMGRMGLIPLGRLFFFAIRIGIEELFFSTSFRISLKRLIIFPVLIVSMLILLIWNHIGFALDDIIFPDWKSQTIIRPLFIVGNARSGTTWLHRLITVEDSFFTTMKTWEIFFAASITWRFLFIKIYKFDKYYFSCYFYNMLLSFEKLLIPRSDLHQFGLMEAEEDEWIMIHIMQSQLIMLLFPSASCILGTLVNFDIDRSLPKNIRDEIFHYYKNCVKRHLYCRRNRNLVFVSKNPPFTMRIESIYYHFPDARVVCLVRDPRQSVPSMISYIGECWAVSCSPSQKYPMISDLRQFCVNHYIYPLGQLNSDLRSCSSWSFVSYSQLKRNVVTTIMNLLLRLEYLDSKHFTDAQGANLLKLEGLLLREQRHAETYVSSHKHSIEECCGMTEFQFLTIFKEIIEAHKDLI